MKGLMVKDFHILMLQRRFLGLVIIISACLAMTMENPAFLIGYITIMCSMLVLSTISYDDMDNGFTFLFTLPITKKEYVLEKYVLAVLVGGCAWLAATVVSISVSAYQMEEYVIGMGITEAVLTLSVCMSLFFVMIPVQIKYGSEKSRVVMLGFVGVVVLLVYLLKILMSKMEGIVSFDLQKLQYAVSSLGNGEIIAGAVLVMAGIMVVTMLVSMRVLEKKEF